MLEISIEKHLYNEVKKRDGMAIKLDSMKGLPDRLVLTPNGKHYFVELKRPEGVLSEIQKEVHRRLIQRGHAVFTLWNINEVDRFIAEVFSNE